MSQSARRLTVRVTSVRREAADVLSFELTPLNGERIGTFSPGAHIDVHIGARLARQYSLCNGPEDCRAFLIAVKKENASRGGSRAMHESVKAGDLLQVSEPRNLFPLNAAAAEHVLLAGGIGITPLLSMARHLAKARAAFRLHYFARSREHAAFHGVLSGAAFARSVSFHLGLETGEVRARLSRLLERRRDGADLYLCGPAAFMEQARDVARHWPARAIHLEHFTPAPALQARSDKEFRVALARRGGTYVVSPHKTIVQVLAEHGISIDVRCEQGICGTCLTTVLEGTPDHRDAFLTEDEQRAGDKMAPCVSRARSELLVLDL